MRRIGNRVRSLVWANKRRKVAAAATSLAVIAAASFAYYMLVINTTGTGSGTQNAAPNTPASATLQLHASWPDGQLMPAGGTVGTQGSGVPLTLTADNTSAFVGTVKTVTLTGVSSTDGACNTVLQNSANGIAVGWPDGMWGGPGQQYAPVGFAGTTTYTESTPVTVPANSTGTVLLTASPDAPTLYWAEDGVDDTACAGKPIQLTFSASS